jgi:hypothetical protein
MRFMIDGHTIKGANLFSYWSFVKHKRSNFAHVSSIKWQLKR